MSHLLPKVVWISFLGSIFVLPVTPKIAAQTAQIRHIGVVKSGASTRIEIETSKRVLPLTEVVTDPDRLVIDFSDAVPGPQLRAVTVNNGEVKGVRVGEVTVHPPVTRIVVDLKSPQPFQLLPSSNSVIVKLGDPSISVAAAPAREPGVRADSIAEVPARKPEVRAERPVSTAAAISAQAAPAASIRVVPASAPAIPASGLTVAPMVSVTRWPVAAATNAQIKHVAVLKSGGATEIEIETSQRVEPAVQAIAGPDRLVIDFASALPGPQLRALAVNQGELKGIRVGLLSARPPVTRVVLDLKSAQVYQVFPSAKSVIVKLPGSMNPATGASMPSISEVASARPAPPPAPKKVDVSFEDGKLKVATTKASLAEILNEVRVQTGADIVVPPGAEQEQVAVTLGPASGREVLSKLLDGSRYNYIIVGTDNDPNRVERVVLSLKTPGGVTPPESQPAIDPAAVAQMQPPLGGSAPPPTVPAPVEEAQPQGDSNQAPPPDVPPPPQPGAPN